METHEIVGIVLVLAGVLDALVVSQLVARRAPDGPQRRIVLAGVVSSGLIMVILGAAFWIGLFESPA